MIDSSRLSHSFATALKDRPHGIPVQPNRSLPLRPPPPLPARISLAKSQKNSPITQVKPASKSFKKSEDAGNGKDNTNKTSPGLEIVGINFYDSKDKEENRKASKELFKSRNAKSLDVKDSIDGSGVDKRRQSLDYETIRRDGKRSVDSVQSGDKKLCNKEKIETSAKKRKSSSAEESPDPKSRKLQKLNSSKSNTGSSHAETKEPTTKSKNYDRVKSCADSWPTIYKYRNSSKLTKRNSKSTESKTEEKSNLKQTGPNTYQFILPKPKNIPQCPGAIPIEIAHALNQGESKNDYCKSSIKPENKTRTNGTISHKPIGGFESTLPSMPSLEDLMQTDVIEKFTVPDKRTISENDETNVSKESAQIAPQKSDDLVAAETIQGNIETIHNHKCDQVHGNESIVNLTTVLEIQILAGQWQDPQITASDKIDSIGDKDTAEVTSPISLPSNVHPVSRTSKGIGDINSVEKTSKEIENPVKICTTSPVLVPSVHEQRSMNILRENDTQYSVKRKSPVKYDRVIKDTSGSSANENPSPIREGDESTNEKTQENTRKIRYAVDEESVRFNKNRHILKIQELTKEESQLRYKMTRVTDPLRSTRLQQKFNCVTKRIENMKKQLDKITSIQINQPRSRINVRRDLVESTPLPESVEHVTESAIELKSDKDNDLTETSPSHLLHDVITISETDSASSGDESDLDCPKSPENLIPRVQPVVVETKIETLSVSKKDDEPTYNPRIPSPKLEVKADLKNSEEFKIQNLKVQPTPVIVNSELTKNNIEPLNKNAPKVCESVPVRLSNVIKSVPPLIRDRGNFSPNNYNGSANQKSPSEQSGVLNLSLPSNKVEEEDRNKSNCKCLTCVRSDQSLIVNNATKNDGNNFVPTTVNDPRNINSLYKTITPENTNVQPVPNYPVHQSDNRTKENVPSMFSRNNGGANINLSSPLQGHSALPLPATYFRNLTAQGYPVPAEPSPNQTIQRHNQHPQNKSSVQFTPDHDFPSKSPLLAYQLLKSPAQEAAKLSNSAKLANLAQEQDVTQTNTNNHHVTNRVITEHFPTFGNWAAQMTREPSVRKPVNNNPTPSVAVPINTQPRMEHNYNTVQTAGSDLYKMAATAVDNRNTAQTTGNTPPWGPGRSWPEQPRPIQSFYNQRNNLRPFVKDYPPNPQSSQNLRPPPYPPSDGFARYPLQPQHQVLPRFKTNGSVEPPNHQNIRQYHPQASLPRPTLPGTYSNQGNSIPMMNPIAMMSQMYPQHPPSYSQAVWQTANNYQNNYIHPQYNCFNNVQNKPVDDCMGFRQNNPNQNHNFVQQQQRESVAPNHSIPNNKVRSPFYNLPGAFNNIVQDVRNSQEPIDLGISYSSPHLANVHKSPDRSSNRICSRCGMTGPKFNCNGCETAFYCNELCQKQHWNTHYLECSKKMPKLKKVS